MTDKQIEIMFKGSMIRMRDVIDKSRTYDQFHWLFLEAFSLGMKEGKKIYAGKP